MAKVKSSDVSTDFIQLKFGLTFTKLLEDNKALQLNNKEAGSKNEKLNASLGKLSSETELRVATLSEIFSGKSNPKAVTIDRILSAMGKTLVDFASIYDTLTENEVIQFEASIIKARALRESKKKLVKVATPPKKRKSK